MSGRSWKFWCFLGNSWEKKYCTNILYPHNVYSRHFSPEVMSCNPTIFWIIFQIVEYKILVQYFFPRNSPGNIKYARKLSKSENSQNTLYFQRIFHFWGINWLFWMTIPFPNYISRLGIIPFSQWLGNSAIAASASFTSSSISSLVSLLLISRLHFHLKHHDVAWKYLLC